MLLALVLAAGVTVGAYGQRTDELLDGGRRALESGDFREAERILQEAVDMDGDLAEAHHLLAQLFLEPAYLDLKRAEQSNGRALNLDPENVDFLTLRLYRLHHYPSGVLPGLRVTQKEDLARRILTLDPDNSFAHFVLGEVALGDYLDARKSVSFPDLDNLVVGASREPLYNAAYLMDPALAPDAGGEMTFQLARTGVGGTVEYVVKDSEASRRYRRAMDELWRAVESDPGQTGAYRLLMSAIMIEWDPVAADRLSRLMVRHLPSSSDTWLFKGVGDFRARRLQEAEASFAKAIALMPAEDASVFEDASLIISELRLDSADKNRWLGKDPMLLTPENERSMEHYVRLAYADLRFGSMFHDTRGWFTEPGEVVVRYGIPLAEAQNSTRFDKYLVLHYGAFYFKFMDLVKAGKLTFYSPKAGSAAPSFSAIDRAYDNDFTLVSNRVFRRMPEKHVYDGNGRRYAFPFLATTFLSDSGPEIVVAFGVPAGGNPSAIRSGLFLLDDRGVILTRDAGVGLDRSSTVEGNSLRYDVFSRSIRVPTARGLTLAVEFEDRDREIIGFQRTSVGRSMWKENALRLSDILLAYLVEEADPARAPALVRGEYAILPAPWGVYEAGSPVYAYFETYGLSDGVAGSVQVEVEARLREYDRDDDLERNLVRLFSGPQQEGVSVRYTGTATAVTDRRYVILDTSGLGRGTYVVGLRLTEMQTGHVATAGRVVILE